MQSCWQQQYQPIDWIDPRWYANLMQEITIEEWRKIIANNNILKGENHAALPDGSTEVLIRIMNLIMEDAKVKRKPLWILFQDLSKAYDRVDIKMLENLDKENVMISSQAYMDDVSWITDTLYKLESILQIADEFNRLNNIQINPDKFTLMTNDTNALKDKSIKLNFGSHVQEIQLIRLTKSIKFNLIASTLAIMYDNNLTCQFNIERKIMGGQLPITQVLNSDLLFKDRLNYHLQRHNIYFLSQIMATDRLRSLTYSDLRIRLGISTKGYTVKGQSSLTIYTDRSFKRHSDTSVMMGSAFKIIETNSIFQCQIQENPSVIKAELMAMIMALLCLDKVKAHDSDDHSNIVDKLAKEACSKECLVIDPKLLANNGTICWNHKPIERNITLMVKDIKETQYIEQFLMLRVECIYATTYI
ncbi:hypothetical protein RclHR1_05580001 [Rhizophagus clarus]|uniref:Reverse transcriptase domain-containing protein n=1 Tax=Rhizophagus clarus TaxID=94130 RepID=A0A2Z6RN21_9GLOM|nr:hypothetical protein RclHR1_05580001 [Rhizophagus clarus]